MNLLCATGLPGAESLDVDEFLDRLDSWSERISLMTESQRSPRKVIDETCHGLTPTPSAWRLTSSLETLRGIDSFHRNPELFENSEPLWWMLGLTRILQQECHIHYHPDCIDQDAGLG